MKEYTKPSLKAHGLLREVTKYSGPTCDIRINEVVVCGKY
jgi:hypothetical protein